MPGYVSIFTSRESAYSQFLLVARFKTTYLATKPRESRPRLEKRTFDLKTNVRLLVGFEAQLVFALQLFFDVQLHWIFFTKV